MRSKFVRVNFMLLNFRKWEKPQIAQITQIICFMFGYYTDFILITLIRAAHGSLKTIRMGLSAGKPSVQFCQNLSNGKDIGQKNLSNPCNLW